MGSECTQSAPAERPGTNLQPWKVHACTGSVKEALSAELVALHDAGGAGHVAAYAYYPKGWREPYLSRRRSEMLLCGMSLGRLDPDAPENALETERVPVAGFAKFHGW